MNVLLISQCSKNALTETRRILDQFAERRGDRTWQTPITQQGLETLRRLLRQTARKNTAVACHWIRGKDHSELLWIVGDARQFNERGATPTNETRRDVLRAGDENDWHSAEIIRLLAALAALFHDVGKANRAFQKKLTASGPVADAFRHEWVSLRLFEAFVGSATTDTEWLERLAALPERAESLLDELTDPQRLVRDTGNGTLRGPFSARPKRMPPLAQLVGWLVVTHHRLPSQWGRHPDQREPISKGLLNDIPASIKADWCGARPDADGKERNACWTFTALPMDSRHWRQRAARTARAILNHPSLPGDGSKLLDDPYVVHLSRLALMLADHYYSGLPPHTCYGDPVVKGGKPLYANSEWKEADGKARREFKQRLDEHLIGVEVNARRIVRVLPLLAGQLPRLARHRKLRKPATDARFRWQNRAFDTAEGLRQRTETQGFFGVNMASTGTGKTIANGRILYALADPKRGARFTIALGLRTLTLQTGDVYREQLELGSDVFAVLVGGGAVRELHEYQKLAATGSESGAPLLEGPDYVSYEGSLMDSPLERWLAKSPEAHKLVSAPLLACTIDHLMPACESTRGGHQIAPMLRLLTSDLVLDEPDDFDTADLPALSRLVHWAGLLGSRVLLSSATLPPALVEGLFEAYREGRRVFQDHRGVPGQPVNVCCAWFDEFESISGECAEPAAFATAHAAFAGRRVTRLATQDVRRRALIRPLNIAHETLYADLGGELLEQAHAFHAEHRGPPAPGHGKRVSLGLIRMAHIDDLVATARAILEQGAREGHYLHLCVYHSRHPLLIRSGIEARLDRLLSRKAENLDPMALFEKPDLGELLDRSPEPDHLVIVLATAVAEVGRDHDYDWAIVEPSSLRSIIQLAGRVRRHREGGCDRRNLCLLDTNVSHIKKPGQPAFCKPGFESKVFRLDSHVLTELLTAEQLAAIDARGRIEQRPELQPAANLADLEHAHLRDLMQLGEKTKPVNFWWRTRAHLTGELQRIQPFRDESEPHRRYAIVPDEDGERLDFRRFEKDTEPTGQSHRFRLTRDLPTAPRIGLWGAPDYTEALGSLAEATGMEEAACALRFGVVDLPESDGQVEWDYHEALGFTRR